GAHVPTVVVAGRAGPRAALLVQRPVTGTRLAELAADEISDVLSHRLWGDVAALGRARVIHGDLEANHVIVHDDQPWIVAFDEAGISGDAVDQATDIAELLASTAALVGDERAVRAAIDGVGGPTVARALPRLQPAALSPETRRLMSAERRHYGERLAELRRVGADALGIDVPEAVQIRRITPTGAAMALGALVAVGALLIDVGDPVDVVDTMRNADWGWILLA